MPEIGEAKIVQPMFWPPSGGSPGLLAVIVRSLVTPGPPARAGLAGGPRDAVRMHGRHRWSPFPVRLDVRNLEPRGDQNLRCGPGEHADDGGQPEELAVERGGAAEPGHEEQQRHDLDEIS